MGLNATERLSVTHLGPQEMWKRVGNKGPQGMKKGYKYTTLEILLYFANVYSVTSRASWPKPVIPAVAMFMAFPTVGVNRVLGKNRRGSLAGFSQDPGPGSSRQGPRKHGKAGAPFARTVSRFLFRALFFLWGGRGGGGEGGERGEGGHSLNFWLLFLAGGHFWKHLQACFAAKPHFL